MTSVTGYFSDWDRADKTVAALLADGAPRQDLSVIANHKHNGRKVGGVETTGVEAGAATGVVLGGAVGVAIGLGALVIPGVGPILAAGPLASALAGGAAGAAAGGVAGGLLGALTDLGMPKDRAERYVEGVRQGGILVELRNVTSTGAERAERILIEHGAQEVFSGEAGGDAVRTS